MKDCARVEASVSRSTSAAFQRLVIGTGLDVRTQMIGKDDDVIQPPR
ncbi:MAG: hypothetical protein IPK52_22250 [Chloroflexi bacterium]|nr:hypothetical protein [Chloroflexota bacterium]